jgi:hypothetical protein
MRLGQARQRARAPRAGPGAQLGQPGQARGVGRLRARWASEGKRRGAGWASTRSRAGPARAGHTRGPTLSKRGKGGFGPRREGKGRLGFYLFISYFFIFCSFLFSPPFQIEFLIKWMLHKITHPIE